MAVIQAELRLSARPAGCHLVTAEVMAQLPPLPEAGLLHLFIKHTSAALTLNENADPDVRHDLARALDFVAPERQPFYRHTFEGDDDMPAHVKSSLVGSSITIPISNHRLALGTWQGIYLCEFRTHGGPRRLVATILS